MKTRRSFLKQCRNIAAAAAVPTVIPSVCIGAGGVAPSNRITMGAVGVGSMGTGDLHGFLGSGDIQVVAVCDVDKRHRERAQNIVNQRYKNKECKAYLDFRELIDLNSLDAMMTALPDQWHALPVLYAARHGIDIHGQKPFARSIREGRAMVDALNRYGCVWQTGSQQRSDGKFRRACELVRNGRIGRILKVEVGLPTGGSRGTQPPIPVPDHLDWNFWLGPAPYRPYCDFGGDSPHWNWRWIMDYSGGQLTDWAGHHIDIAQWGLGFERTGPVSIEGRGVYPEDGLYNTPMQYRFVCTYANGLQMTVANNQQITQGAKWIGEDGWVHVNRGGLSAEPKSLLNEVIGPNEIHLYKSNGHKQNFIDCIKTRKETIAPAEIGHRSISVALIGEIAMLTGRKIRWNPDTEEIIGDPGASALLERPYREPWSL